MHPRNLRYWLRGTRWNRRLTSAPVVVGGCERSGTTLFQSILSAHPGIHVIPVETWALCHGPAAGFPDRGGPIRMNRLKAHLGRDRPDDSATRWCEKSPANIFFADEILSHFGRRVRFIQVVRDGRDVVTSLHPRRKDRPWVSIRRWKDAIGAGAHLLGRDDVLTVKYESIVTDHERTLERVCDFIGEEYVPEMRAWSDNASVAQSANLVGGVVGSLSTRSLRKWRQDGFRFQRIIDAFMDDPEAVGLLEELGYDSALDARVLTPTA